MIILPLINSNILIDELNVFVFMFIFIMGITSASAMMIPGISGSLVLMVFGLYLLILENINNFISMVISFNFENIISPFLVLFIFGLGILVGIFSISKIIKKQFEKRRRTVYCAIFGLLISSVFSIIYATVGEYNEVINWKDPFVYIISVLMFILGSTIVCTLEKMEKNKETN
jgi:putative membrane protein